MPWTLLLYALAACSTMTVDAELQVLPVTCRQALVVRARSDEPTAAVVHAWQRQGDSWSRAMAPMPARLGRSGVVAAAQKREGDGGTPAGVHTIGTAFGYAPTAATRLAYRQATARDWWIDAPASPAYNTWTTSDGKPAVSAEAMRRDDDQYELGAVLGWNTDPIVKGRGSAIFLHVWKSPSEPTSGCVALSRDAVAAVLAWFDAAQQPCVLVVGSAP